MPFCGRIEYFANRKYVDKSKTILNRIRVRFFRYEKLTKTTYASRQINIFLCERRYETELRRFVAVPHTLTIDRFLVAHARISVSVVDDMEPHSTTKHKQKIISSLLNTFVEKNGNDMVSVNFHHKHFEY